MDSYVNVLIMLTFNMLEHFPVLPLGRGNGFFFALQLQNRAPAVQIQEDKW